MSDARSGTGILVGLAVAGAFGAAAMMSAATAPTARADDFTDVINVVDADYANGQAAFTTALTDFSSANFAGGLAELFDGSNDDSLSAPDNLLAGTVAVLANETVQGPISYTFSLPADYSEGVIYAETVFSEGQTFFTDASSALSLGEFSAAAYDDLLGADYVTVVPLEELLLGGAASF
jgi:hypothetical protein